MKIEYQINGKIVSVDWKQEGDRWSLKWEKTKVGGRLLEWAPPYFEVQMGEEILKGAFYRGKGFLDVHIPQGNFRLRFQPETRARQTHSGGELKAPMPGKILLVLVREGERVKKGAPLMVLEAMKMEHKILSPYDGVVKKIFFREGERVSPELELVEVQK